jgi:hypothetical protein
MTRQTLSLVVSSLLWTGCAGASLQVPLQAGAGPEPELTLVWVGRGECERLEGGVWVRREELDYEFSVEQRRLGDHWESVKSLRRRHPAYDGAAGERVQTYFFRLDFAPGGAVALHSTLGDGTGTTDPEFRTAKLRFAAAGVSSMAPFDRYRITQTYDYEGGQLRELVELNKGDAPWVRNREVATLFAARRFEGAPTRAASK